MKLGFVSAILPDLSLAEVIDFAAESGFRCVELMCWPVSRAERRYAGVTHVDVTALDDTAATAIRRLTFDTGVEISALGYYPNPLTPNAEDAAAYIAHLRRVIEAAAMLGVTRVNTFVGRDASLTVDQNWPRFLTVWGPLLEMAEQFKVRIGIENCPMLYTSDEWPGGHNLAYCPAIWRRMFRDLPSPSFGLNYDPSHLVWQQIDHVAPLREFSTRLVHVHAKDVRIDTQRLNQVGILATPLEYHTPKLPGLGQIDWGKFFSVLGDVGYRGPVCIEVEDRAYEASLESRKAALRQSAAWLRNFTAEDM
jgi:sugar phosphate isomerase/epimerase